MAMLVTAGLLVIAMAPITTADDITPMTFCTADSTLSAEFPASNVCDQDVTSRWFSAGTAYPHWLELAGIGDGSVQCVSSIALSFADDGRPLEWRIEGWNASLEIWDILRDEFPDPGFNDMHTYDFEPYNSANFRIFGVSGNGTVFMGLREANVNECNATTTIITITAENADILIIVTLLVLLVFSVIVGFWKIPLFLLLGAAIAGFLAVEIHEIFQNWRLSIILFMIAVMILFTFVIKMYRSR